MEFQGRIQRLLPQRQGTSQKTGKEWVSQPFIFEYFEHETDRWADRVVLETFDTGIIAQLQEGAECFVGFSHTINEYNGKVYNELRLYKFQLKTGTAPTITDDNTNEDPF